MQLQEKFLQGFAFVFCCVLGERGTEADSKVHKERKIRIVRRILKNRAMERARW